jgi:hypothetical protein
VVQIWTHGLGGPELRETIKVEELCVETPELVQDPQPISSIGEAASSFHQAS